MTALSARWITTPVAESEVKLASESVDLCHWIPLLGTEPTYNFLMMGRLMDRFQVREEKW